MTAGGKGSAPRPFSVTQEEYDKRWDAIFGKDLKNEEPTEEEEEAWQAMEKSLKEKQTDK